MSIVEPGQLARSSLATSVQDRLNLAELHESVATLLASRHDFRGAYQHCQSAYSLVRDTTHEHPEALHRELDLLRREHAKVLEQSLRDSLTASYNRRYLDQRLLELVTSTTTAGRATGVAIVDLDLFKLVNDEHGHHIGDRVLQVVVELLQHDLPCGAFCARYGGEEFVLVLPDLSFDTCVALVEQARARIELYSWGEISPALRLTASFGVMHGNPETTEEFEKQLANADRLLYAAKKSGRNAVAYSSDGTTRLAGSAGKRRAIVQTTMNW